MTAGLETYRGIAHPWFCDSMGHMNTRHYAAMFDDAAFHLLGAIAGPAALATAKRGWADVRHTHEFRHEARAGTLVVVRSAVTRLGTKSLTYRHAMTNVESGDLHAVSEAVTVFFDLENRVALPLTDALRAQARALLVEGFAPVIDLTGNTVLVTGSGRGIGAAIARAVVSSGGSVVLHDRRAEGLADVHGELGAERSVALAADLAQTAQVASLWDQALAWRGRIDVLVNNAGIYEPADIDDPLGDWSAAWQRTLEVNLKAPAQLCREAIRHFRERGGGIIVNLASRAAFRGDDADYQHYAASKAGIVAMTRTIARHYGRSGITAFAVAGFVRTDLNAAFFAEHGVEGAARDIPLGEIAEPEDIANTVLFLASGLARHATGTTIDINGASYVR